MSIDPAEPNVRAKNYSSSLPNFDKEKHAHVIQDQYCTVCEVDVWVYCPYQKQILIFEKSEKLKSRNFF